jgi:hypothetical protein
VQELTIRRTPVEALQSEALQAPHHLQQLCQILKAVIISEFLNPAHPGDLEISQATQAVPGLGLIATEL